MQAAFETRMRSLLGLMPPRRIALAVSGGVDSMALASLASQWAPKFGLELHGLIVDHGLRSESTSEVTQVASLLKKMGILPSVLRLDLRHVDATRIEAVARDGRRALLQQACWDNRCQALVHGHHLNDQQELLVMRLLSNSTWYGLAGMSPISWLDPERRPGRDRWQIRLVKPFLDVPKARLREWCVNQNLEWFEDPTNADPTLTQRNLVRQYLSQTESDVADVVKPKNLNHLLSVFGTQRSKLELDSRLVHDELTAAGDLLYHRNPSGFASLKVPPEFRLLQPAVQTQVLFMIVAQISPLKTDSLFLRRSATTHITESLARVQKSGADFVDVRLGVRIKYTGSKSVLTFERARPRRDECSGPLDVLEARKNWSEWKKIDRWWFRWKLPSGTPYRHRLLTARFIYDTDEGMDILRGFFGDPSNEFTKKYRQLLPSQPFFAFTNPRDPQELNPGTAVGFPTLGLVRGLEIEHEFQKYVF